MFNKSLVIVAAAVALAACGKKEEPQNNQYSSSEQTQQTPAAQQQQHQGFDWGTAAIGAAAGYMLGNATSSRSNERVVERQVPVYTPQPNRQIAPTRVAPTPTAPKPVAPVSPPAPAVQPSKSSYNSGFSGYGSVRQSAPTYRSSPSISRGRR